MPTLQCFLLGMFALWHRTVSILCLVGGTGLAPGGISGSVLSVTVSRTLGVLHAPVLPPSLPVNSCQLTLLCFPHSVHICGVLRLCLASGEKDQRHFPLGWDTPQSKFNKCSSCVVLERKRRGVCVSGFSWLPVPKWQWEKLCVLNAAYVCCKLRHSSMW